MKGSGPLLPIVVALHGGPGMRGYLVDTLPCELVDFVQGDFCPRAPCMQDVVEALHREVQRWRAEGRDVYLLGHSFGGALALEYLARYPGDAHALAGVILVSWVYDTAPFKTVLDKLGEGATNMSMQDIVLGLVDLYFPSARSRRIGGHMLAQAQYDENFYTQMRGYLSNLNLRPALQALQRSELRRVSLGGRADVITPPEYLALGARLAGKMRPVSLDGGHFPWVEDPRAFRQAVASFISECCQSQNPRSRAFR